MSSFDSTNACTSQIWRTSGLVRLYVGFLLFSLSDKMNPVKRGFSFEQWYMFYFYDIQLWERKRSQSEQRVHTSLVARLNRSTNINSLGATLSSAMNSEMQVIEVIRRVTEVAKVCSLFFVKKKIMCECFISLQGEREREREIIFFITLENKVCHLLMTCISQQVSSVAGVLVST
jgi:hypothetical protein